MFVSFFLALVAVGWIVGVSWYGESLMKGPPADDADRIVRRLDSYAIQVSPAVRGGLGIVARKVSSFRQMAVFLVSLLMIGLSIGLLARERIGRGTGYASPTWGYLAKRLGQLTALGTLVALLVPLNHSPAMAYVFASVLAGTLCLFVANIPPRI